MSNVKAIFSHLDCLVDAIDGVKSAGHADFAVTAPLPRHEIEELAKMVRNNADFAELATLFSHAPSAEHGGDLGLRNVDELASEIAKAASQLEEGEVSDPIRSKYGFHILKLVERKPPSYRELDTARDAITAKIQQQQFEERMDSFVEELRAKSFVREYDSCYGETL